MEEAEVIVKAEEVANGMVKAEEDEAQDNPRTKVKCEEDEEPTEETARSRSWRSARVRAREAARRRIRTPEESMGHSFCKLFS